MNHQDHVTLLQNGIPGPGGVWADFGSGRGAFTLALADLIGETGHIYSVDKNGRTIQQQKRRMQDRFPQVTVHYHTADFSQPLDLPSLDGAIMANALHFVRHKDQVVQLMRSYLKPDGRFILVEYDTDRGNRWVPYPLSYQTWVELASRNDFSRTQLLATRPSRFLGQIYAAASQ